MSVRFVNPLPFVRDMARSKAFYCDVLGLEIEQDHGNFVRFHSGFALHEGGSLLETTFGKAARDDAPYGRKNLVLYFESDALAEVFSRVSNSSEAEIIHPIQPQAWGQRVFRFFDPDRHIVEIGEPPRT